jgi:hypothetical protein
VSIQRYMTASGAARYRARVKSHGRVVASSVFSRRADAVAWEQISIGVCEVVSGWTHVEDELILRWSRRLGWPHVSR